MALKPLVWLGDSLERVRTFATVARKEIGFQLWEVQQGMQPSDWKPMRPIGPGVQELRVRAGSSYRVIYVATLLEAVYVLHAFEKQSRKAAQPDMELARVRFRALIQDRSRR
jgi:phage-related protein